jgi:hypothetical protein
LGPLHVGYFLWRPDLNQARNNFIALSSAVDEEIGGYRTDGPKNNVEFSAPPCGSTFGDSYVGGFEVAENEGWVEQLSHLLGCRFANYSVPGYGTDQAYLRFLRAHDESTVALLGINPNNIMDNINQYDGFLASELSPIGLKGRYIISQSDHLEWLPWPRLDVDGFVALQRNPAATLPNSYFLPDTPDGPISAAFPYTVSLVRIVLMTRLHNILTGRAEWSSFYSADHPSGALQLMTAICEAFVELARSRNKHPLVIMLPLAPSFREKANYGDFEYAPLVAALRAKDIEVFDPGSAMVEAIRGRSVCEFYTHQHPETSWVTSPVPCSGHYSVFGNTMIAHLVALELRRRKLLQ